MAKAPIIYILQTWSHLKSIRVSMKLGSNIAALGCLGRFTMIMTSKTDCIKSHVCNCMPCAVTSIIMI